MNKPFRQQNHPGYYLYDDHGYVVGLSEVGVAAEPERECVIGGGLFDVPEDECRNPSIAVLHAPSMPRRFQSVEINSAGVFMIRVDGVRCRIECDPLLAEQATLRETMTNKEAGDHFKDCIEYEVALVPELERAMRM